MTKADEGMVRLKVICVDDNVELADYTMNFPRREWEKYKDRMHRGSGILVHLGEYLSVLLASAAGKHCSQLAELVAEGLAHGSGNGQRTAE